MERKNLELKQKREELEARISKMRAQFEMQEQQLMQDAHELQSREEQLVLDREEMGRTRSADQNGGAELCKAKGKAA